jgi:hypothetical protein
MGEVGTRTSVKGERQSETARHISLSFNMDTMNQSCHPKKLPGFKQGASVGQSTNDTAIGEIRVVSRSEPCLH